MSRAMLPKGKRCLGALALGAVGAAALTLSVPAARGQSEAGVQAPSAPAPPPRNRLKGVVVWKKDGRPLAGARVAMADARDGYIYFAPNGLQVYGPEQKVLYILRRHNSKTACEATTDAQGRFTFESFAHPSQPYNVGLLKTEGDAQPTPTTEPESFARPLKAEAMAVLTDIRPGDYADKELKIEVEAPAFIQTERPPAEQPGRAWRSANVSLEPPRPADAKEEPESPRVYFFTGYPFDTERAGDKETLGPLPPGHKYRLSVYGYSEDAPFAATYFERVVPLEGGQTADISQKLEGGAKLAGHVTGIDGQPLVGVNVMVKVGPDAGLVVGALTDKRGSYEIANVPAGTHKLELLRHAKRTAPG